MMLLSMSMSIIDSKLAICTGCVVKVKVENNVFANSLMGTTTQDGGMRERSDDDLYCPKLKLRKINKNKNIRVQSIL